MQRSHRSDGLARISVATRELHGLRPKNLMVRLARQIGHVFGCNNMILVGNVNRAAHRSVRKGLVFADYDALWRGLGHMPVMTAIFNWPAKT
ncbi:MAG: DUF535 family protein [bacterium]